MNWSNPDYMGPKIGKLVKELQYPLLNDEKSELFIHKLVQAYENTASMFEMDCVPLKCDLKQGMVEFPENFKDNPNFLKWREMFLEKFVDEFGDFDEDDDYDFEDEFDDEPDSIEEGNEQDIDEPIEELPDLEYRCSNDNYAHMVLKRLIHGMDDAVFNMEADRYGWIENRRNEFLRVLGEYCEKYALPRMGVEFSEDEVKLIGFEQEITDFHFHATWREQELEYAQDKEFEIFEAEKEAARRKVSRENYGMEVQRLNTIYSDKLSQVELACYERWVEENKTLSFPSNVGKYVVEISREYFVSATDMVVDEEVDEAPPKASIVGVPGNFNKLNLN